MVRELFKSGVPEVGLTHRERQSVAIGLIVLALLVAAGLYGVVRIAEEGRERDLESWRVRLGVVAESRVSAVNGWLERHAEAVDSIAGNTSVQLYVTELSMTGATSGGAAQRQYLENLLAVSAERSGFVTQGGVPDVPANLASARSAGIAIIGMDGEVLATTRRMPDLRTALADRPTEAPRMFSSSESGGLLVFVSPVFGVQADPGTGAPLAWVAGAKPIAADLFATLRQPGEISRTGETYLVQVEGDRVKHLSPLAGVGEGDLPSDVMAEDQAARFAASGLGGLEIATDYSGARVLVVGRAVNGPLGWTLVRTVSAEEALSEIESRRNFMLVVLGISVLAAGALVLLVWRHGASVRAATAARRIAKAASEYERLGGFLEVVTNSQPTGIIVIDGQGDILLANKTVAEQAEMAAADMRGKNLANVFGGEIARPLLGAAKGLEEESGLARTISLETAEEGKYLKADLVALDFGDEGDVEEGQPTKSTLIVLEDLSELMAARARREQSLKSLVQVLVSLIDARDPYSARHSAKVAEIAGSIATSMNLDPVSVETVETAGALLNLGKLTVPKDILTRPDNLSAEEMEIVRGSMLRSAELIEGLAFDGPVADTLKQIQAHWDGSGNPQGLRGEDILLTARVLAVANAFVAMISPRAHRPGKSLDDTVHVLLGDAEKAYDRRVIAALIHFLENEGGRENWQNPEAVDAGALAPVD